MATEREYLVSKGLAKPSRGRFSGEAKAELERARAAGMVFDEPVKPTPKAVKPVASTQTSPAATLDKPKSSPTPSPAKGSYDPKAVRKWAEEKGLVSKGQRGRLPAEVIHKYVTENGAAAPKATPKPAPPKVRVRPENYAWAFQAGNPAKGHSDIRIQFGDCANCHQRIGFCACKTGPVGPKWLGSPVLSLTKP